MKGMHASVCLLFWNKQMRDFAKSFYKSKRWQAMRDYIIKRDRGLCQDCLEHGIVMQAEEVHHIIPLNESNINDASIALGESNLVSLCRECHQKRHRRKEKRYRVDADGHVMTT